MELFLKNILTSINKFSDGKHTVFAKKAGIPPSTFQSYMKGNMPKPEHLIRISETYKISIDWLLTGKGEMIREPAKERDIYTSVSEEPPIYKVNKNNDDDPETENLLQAALRVLKSNNKVAIDTLKQNIRYFDHAIKTETRLNGMDKNMTEIKKIMGELAEENKNIKARLRQSDRIRNDDQEAQRGDILKKRII